VKNLVENLYNEANSTINANLGVAIASVQPVQVEKAEAVLLHIQQVIKGDFQEFYRYFGVQVVLNLVLKGQKIE
jgi:hypothetical protein